MTIKLVDTTMTSSLEELIKESKIEITRKNKLGYIDLKLPENSEFTVILKKYLNNSLFESVEMNSFGKVFVNPDDPGYSSQHHLNHATYKDINATWSQMWYWEDGSSHPVVVAVLDMGVDDENYDINLWDGPGTSFGWNFIDDNSDASPQIIENVLTDHGTGVAGIIGAKTNNDEGVTGVAGGYNSDGSEIMALRVGEYYWNDYWDKWFDRIDGDVVDDAIIYAANNGAKILNMSFGVDETSAINAAISYSYKKKGCLLVAACGNGNKSTAFGYPASHSLVMAIAGIEKDGDPYGDYGGTIEVVAPSEDIYTTGNYTNNDHYYYYEWGTGTSASAPQVAGAAALLWSFEPDGIKPVLLPMDIKNLINQTASYVGSSSRYGNGLLFPGAALEWLDGSPDVNSPTISFSGGLGDHPTISWPKVGNNISYKVYRADSDGGRYYFTVKASIPYSSSTQTYSWTDNSVIINRFGPLTYFYRVTAIDAGGTESVTSNEKSCKSNSAQKPIGEISLNEEKFELYHNYPNPFNPVTNIRFSLNKGQRVIINVYDIRGKLIEKLVDKTMQKGRHSVRFDAKDLASGVYFYTFNAGDIKLTRKMMLLR